MQKTAWRFPFRSAHSVHLFVLFSIAFLPLLSGMAHAGARDGIVKIGVLTDMSGPYGALAGEGAVAAVKLAVNDCLKTVCKGMKIEVLSADHQNKADIASAKAREWIDDKNVDMIVDLTNSAVALAVQKFASEKGVITIANGPGSTKLTNEECAPLGFHWMYDTYAMGKGTAATVTKQGNDTWYFITVDYAFGQALEKDSTSFITANGGKVLGGVKHPLNASDFSSFILQAQASKAKVIGMANTGQDIVNALKTAREYGVSEGGQKIAGLAIFLSDVHAMGLPTAQGLIITSGFYWDMDANTRAFAKEFSANFKGLKPTMVQAGDYSATLHYLKAVAKLKDDDGKAVAAEMRKMSIDDPVMHNASIRPDGRVIHDMYLFQIKKPDESKYPWDYYKLLTTIPAADAFKPLSESACSLVKK